MWPPPPPADPFPFEWLTVIVLAYLYGSFGRGCLTQQVTQLRGHRGVSGHGEMIFHVHVR